MLVDFTNFVEMSISLADSSLCEGWVRESTVASLQLLPDPSRFSQKKEGFAGHMTSVIGFWMKPALFG